MSVRQMVLAALAVALLCVAPLAAEDQLKTVSINLLIHKVAYHDVQEKVIERGMLDSVNNYDVRCEDVTTNRGAATIKWIVDNGSLVKKGDLLVELDDSYLQDRATDLKILRDMAVNDLETAEKEDKLRPQREELIKSEESSVKHAESWLESARADLKSFDNGGAEALRKDYRNQLTGAEADQELWRERVAIAEKKLKDGKTTEALVKAMRLKQKVAAAMVEKYKGQLADLEDNYLPNHRKQLEASVETAQAALKSAQQNLEVQRQQNENTDKQAKASLLIARARRDQEEAKYKDCMDQIRKCKTYAPRAGQVFYPLPEQTRRGEVLIIAKGEPAHSGQKLLSIPDLSHMLVQVRISETDISHLKTGLLATVSIDTLRDKKLKGHVKSVAPVASPLDWRLPNVKTYPVQVVIDDAVEGLQLKPFMSSTVTIVTEAKAEHVLAVPLRAVVSAKEKGAKPRLLVNTVRGPEEREVDLGLNDGQMVEVKAGLKAGEEVILNWRVLLGS